MFFKPKKENIVNGKEVDIHTDSHPDFSAVNNAIECFQKTAWRLVRAAEDVYGPQHGKEKLSWCLSRMREIWGKTGMSDGYYEDYIRSAYMNFKIEATALERKVI